MTVEGRDEVPTWQSRMMGRLDCFVAALLAMTVYVVQDLETTNRHE
ncbi:MAG: hypothetical protein WBK77_01895 [Alphaproteobacteria bacterium]